MIIHIIVVIISIINPVNLLWIYLIKVTYNEFSFQLEAQRVYADFQNQAWYLISRIDRNNIRDPSIRRRLRYLSIVGPSALPPDQLDRVINKNELSI